MNQGLGRAARGPDRVRRGEDWGVGGRRPVATGWDTPQALSQGSPG